MTLPPSFLKSGFLPPGQAALGGRKFKRLLIGTDGEANTGKTEFGLSAPGPLLMIALDRNFDATIDNPSPPPARCNNYAIQVVQAPGFTQADRPTYLRHWNEFYKTYLAALDNPDARTVLLDGDGDSWELQRLAEFGTLTNVPGPPGLAYTGVQYARCNMYRRAWDSGKIIIATNKVREGYEDVLDAKGQPELDNSGRVKRKKSGQLERKGFEDRDYLFHIQLRHMRKDAGINKVTGKPTPMRFGIKIISAKANMELVGEEMWGESANFRSLVELVYPDTPLDSWGF